MKFVEVKEVPGLRSYHNLKVKWDEFMSMNVKVVKIDLDEEEYKSVYTARDTISRSVKNLGYPITVTVRNNEIYLIRRDM